MRRLRAYRNTGTYSVPEPGGLAARKNEPQVFADNADFEFISDLRFPRLSAAKFFLSFLPPAYAGGSDFLSRTNHTTPAAADKIPEITTSVCGVM